MADPVTLVAMPDLQGMQDIVLPKAPPYWPETPAWLALGLVVLALLVWAALHGVRRWHADAYRREALRQIGLATHQDDPALLAALVKRTALAAYPRARVAGLAGRDWVRFLTATAPAARLSEAEALLLVQWPYLPAPDHAQAKAVAAVARHWVARHDRTL